MSDQQFIFNKMSKKKLLVSFTALFVTAVIFTILFYNYSLNISQVIRTDADEFVVDSNSIKKPVVYIGVISRYPPNIIYRGYQPILDYLTSKSNYRFELKLSDDYNQAVNMLINKEVSAAFLGSYVYVKAHKEYGVIPILKPLNENFEPFSRSVLITKSSSDIYNIGDLKMKRLALPSKESFSSNWILQYEFKKNSIKKDDLAEITNFPHHQSVIQNVSKGNYDVGVTREYLVKKITDGSIRVILYSEPFPTSPIVIASDYPKQIVDAIKNTLLEINHNNPNRESITKGWDSEFIYGFVDAKDEDYNFIRTISK
jgi:phosphonate transport system substrate-binding protein